MWEAWIESYGYLAVFVGALLEGETIFVIAGYSISRGYLDPLPTFLLAVVGATGGDSLYYWLGRRYGTRLLRGLPTLRPLRARAVLILRRRGRAAAFAARFAYGLRIAAPLVIGASRMPALTFHAFNLAAAATFASLYLGAGFLFGEAMQQWLDRVRPYETRILLGILCTGLLAWAIREWRLYRSIPPEVEREMAKDEIPAFPPRERD